MLENLGLEDFRLQPLWLNVVKEIAWFCEKETKKKHGMF
jgi:hypothetical protein